MVTPVHRSELGNGGCSGDSCDEGDNGGDGGEDECGADDGHYVMSVNNLRDYSSVLPNEHTVIMEYAWPWLPGGLDPDETSVGAPVNFNVCGAGEGVEVYGDDDELSNHDGASSVLPGRTVASKAYVWHRLSVSVHDAAGNIKTKQGITGKGRFPRRLQSPSWYTSRSC